jgi:adenylosuccinate synthase
MPTVAVVGAQWGDEGTGKIIDLLAEKVDMVARFSGGSNAGHTVVNPQGEFKLHLVPSGVFHPGVTCVIGNGVVIDPAVLIGEIDGLRGRGVAIDRFFISDRAHLIMPYHLLLDRLEEESRGKGAIGTTRRGIGPAYMDKVGRIGIRAGDLLERDTFRERLSQALEQKNRIITGLYKAEPVKLDQIYDEYCRYGELLAPFITATELMVAEALEQNKKVLLEGAQGTLLDIDFGTYPFVTSTTTMAGGACGGLGLGPLKFDRVAGVFKAYCTRVGSGPMPTELLDETGELIREHANERGATTGRPRRCGWFDGVVGRYSARVNGFSSFILTRLDILSIMTSIKVCTAYKLDGETVVNPPYSASALERCEPIYEELPGWGSDITGARRFDDLPEKARSYVKRLEELLGCPAGIISVGERREQTVVVRELF